MLGILVGIAAYPIGSIPFGVIIGRLFSGKDVRKSGSGNIGATNVLRTAGKVPGLITLLLDVGKGYLAVMLAERFSTTGSSLAILAGLLVLLGHCFPIFLKFRGGKGVATGFGVFLRLAPFHVLIALGAFVVVTGLTRLVSAGSIAAAIAMPISLLLSGSSNELIVVSLAIAALIISKHHTNIARIMQGRENRLGRKKEG